MVPPDTTRQAPEDFREVAEEGELFIGSRPDIAFMRSTELLHSRSTLGNRVVSERVKKRFIKQECREARFHNPHPIPYTQIS